MRIAALVCVASLCASATAQISWTENFDDGYGRFTGTQGSGDSLFPWNSDDNLISGTFIRYGPTDSRYAPLTREYDIWEHVLRFSAAVQPISGETHSTRSLVNVGFLHSRYTHMRNCIEIRFSNGTTGPSIKIGGQYDSGYEIDPRGAPPGSISFDFGSWYFVDAVVDGPAQIFTVNIYAGRSTDGSLLTTLIQTLDPTQTLIVDSIGLFNYGDGGPSTFIANIDDISVTQPRCLTDINEDGLSDFSDFLAFLNLYLLQDLSADFTDDDLIDFSDYLEFINLYEAGC